VSLPVPKFATIKNKYLLQLIKDTAKREYSAENYDFYFSKLGNQQLYNTFISNASPRQVNLPNKTRKPLDDLAAKKQWSSMSAGIKQARADIASLLENDTLARMARTEEGQLAFAFNQMGIDAKAPQARALLEVYKKARSPHDKYQAYLGLIKLSNKAKVDAALKGLDMPPPNKPEDEAVTVARNEKMLKLVRELQAALPKALSYYASAIKSVKKDGLPLDEIEQRRMFESGRMRHDKLHEAWGVAIRSDKEFSKKYKDVAKLKKELDDAWAEYRSLLRR
jgi:hypothetical protein